MADSFYDKGRQASLEGSIAYLTDTIKAVLLDNAYTPNLATDQFYSDVSAHAVGTPVALASKTSTNGTANAAATVFASLSGSTVKYIGIYKDTGVAGTSPLIALLDSYTGLPFTPNGASATITWPGSGIYKL